MKTLITGIALGLLLGYGAHAFAQFGSPRLDERAKNWNEQQYQQRQQKLYNESQQWRKPC